MERTPEESARRKQHGMVLLCFVVGCVVAALYTLYFQ
jgi:hypothetical protein